MARVTREAKGLPALDFLARFHQKAIAVPVQSVQASPMGNRYRQAVIPKTPLTMSLYRPRWPPPGLPTRPPCL
jgi:hypothetical protein